MLRRRNSCSVFGALVGITVLGLPLLVGNESSQGPGQSASQLPSGWSELGLSKDQRTKIQAIQGECKLKIAEVERQLKELQAEERRRMVAVLTTHQQETLRGKHRNAEPIIVEQDFVRPSNAHGTQFEQRSVAQVVLQYDRRLCPKVGFYTKFNVSNGAKDYLHVWRVWRSFRIGF